jgi:hypothetical protein
MRAETSFSQKLKAGWTKERLMAYYALTEAQYERILCSLKDIWTMQTQKGENEIAKNN